MICHERRGADVPIKVRKSPSPGFNSLSDLFKLLDKPPPEPGSVRLYRGHSDKNHVLRPSLFRKPEHRKVERHILRELLAIQPNEFRDDKTAFERLVRMQHYGLPTRLLDLTYNPLVGLFFACWHHPDRDGTFFRFRVRGTAVKYFDSDAVSCVANLSNLTGRERDEIRALQDSAVLGSSAVGTRLLHFIKGEKPYFEPRIELHDLKSVFAVRPQQTNRRILAQQGAFLIFGLVSLLKKSSAIEIDRKTVPAAAKKGLLAELDRININESTLFPEIESAAKYIISKIPPNAESDEASD